MKRGWKIALISVGSLLGVVLLTVGIAIWLIFTPAQLTKIVNRLVANNITSEVAFGEVNLTLFRTFPDAGLVVNQVEVRNPMPDAPSDVVAHLDNLTVGIDVKKFLKENEIVVHQVLLKGIEASLYVDSAGACNYDIFPHSEKEKDTTKSSFSLNSLPNIDLRRVKIEHLTASYLNCQSGMQARVQNLDVNVVGTLQQGAVDATLKLGSDSVALLTQDSVGRAKLDATLRDLALTLKGRGNMSAVNGQLMLKVEGGTFNNGGVEMVNAQLQASKSDLLTLNVPFQADLDRMYIALDKSTLRLDNYTLLLNGNAQLPSDQSPLTVDLQVNTNDPWQVAPLLDLVPQQFVSFRKGMDMDAKVQFSATAVGALTDTTMPLIDATVELNDGRFAYPKALPYKVNHIAGRVGAHLDLSEHGVSRATIHSLKAHTNHTDLALHGTVDDLMGDMKVDAYVKGQLPLADAKPMIPDSLPIQAEGDADIDLHAAFSMSQLTQLAFDKMKATGTIRLHQLDVHYDSIHAQAPDLTLAVQLPAKQHAGKMAEAKVQGSQLQFAMNNIEARVNEPDILVGVNNIMREQLQAAFDITLGNTQAHLDSHYVDVNALMLNGSIRMDSTQNNILRQLNPNLNIDLRRTSVQTNLIDEGLYINNLDFHYTPELCDIANADIKLGNSDLQLYGSVVNLEPWLSHEAMLGGELNLTSHYTDVDQLMSLFSGMGSDKDTLEQMRQEDKVPSEANPFIVPLDVDFILHTHLQRSLAFGNDLGDVAGSVSVKDGVAVLDQIGFVCKAATMQLTALYRSPRPNNLFCALDFHLLDIQISELLDMIPTVDTLVPMLAAFDGNANFHLAAETFLDARYQPKMSTLLGSAAISGEDLVVMDNNSIAQIAKLMQFKSWKDKDNKIKIDSLSVELTAFRKEIEVFPFLINIGNYQLCASGKHTLDNQCGYHVELLKNPLLAKVGVDVTGSLKSPKISLGEVRYADLYKPQKQGVVEKETLRLKQMIREALENNVR